MGPIFREPWAYRTPTIEILDVSLEKDTPESKSNILYFSVDVPRSVGSTG